MTDEEEAAPGGLKRIVFDEGHHLFDAADGAFSSHLSALEAAELRRWLRGPETERAAAAASRIVWAIWSVMKMAHRPCWMR